jgi:sporulation protein YlmC with PRC-barrel domain
MEMPDQAEMMEWRGCEVVDQDGDKVGKLDEIYLDRETGTPEWAIVNTGLFGRKSSFVPLKEALREGEMIRVPYQKEQIKDAPNVDPDGEITPEEEQQVYAHYGLEYSQSRSGSGLGEGTSTGESSVGEGAGSRTSGTTGREGVSNTSTAGTSTAGTSAAGTSSSGTGESGTGGSGTGGSGTSQPGTSGSGTGTSETDAGTTGTSAAGENEGGNGRSGGMRLQRMIREDVRVGGEGEVVERRTVEEERLRPDED